MNHASMNQASTGQSHYSMPRSIKDSKNVKEL